jgi:hypothetical protein
MADDREQLDFYGKTELLPKSGGLTAQRRQHRHRLKMLGRDHRLHHGIRGAGAGRVSDLLRGTVVAADGIADAHAAAPGALWPIWRMA